jgi:hypothetical protein
MQRCMLDVIWVFTRGSVMHAVYEEREHGVQQQQF